MKPSNTDGFFIFGLKAYSQLYHSMVASTPLSHQSFQYNASLRVTRVRNPPACYCFIRIALYINTLTLKLSDT